ncbi:hypothetical protein XENOCAPTIV_002036 [Xenoophorus captivus]|uniref:Uncharacterized protein n=1 Tax=Xenoophorus captivus TaxID=1517983 RepID=A0ABV0RWD7_9TELE
MSTASISEDIRGKFPLHSAVWENDYGKLEQQIGLQQDDIEAVDPRGRTPLHLAVDSHAELMEVNHEDGVVDTERFNISQEMEEVTLESMQPAGQEVAKRLTTPINLTLEYATATNPTAITPEEYFNPDFDLGNRDIGPPTPFQVCPSVFEVPQSYHRRGLSRHVPMSNNDDDLLQYAIHQSLLDSQRGSGQVRASLDST